MLTAMGISVFINISSDSEGIARAIGPGASDTRIRSTDKDFRWADRRRPGESIPILTRNRIIDQCSTDSSHLIRILQRLKRSAA